MYLNNWRFFIDLIHRQVYRVFIWYGDRERSCGIKRGYCLIGLHIGSKRNRTLFLEILIQTIAYAMVGTGMYVPPD